MTDSQVNDCAERLSQLGVPVNGSTNPKVGYIKNPMACERCVYGSGEHADYCSTMLPDWYGKLMEAADVAIFDAGFRAHR